MRMKKRMSTCLWIIVQKNCMIISLTENFVVKPGMHVSFLECISVDFC